MMASKFMKGYVKELARARGDLSKGSLKHCHAYGLHSIILREDPIVRLFVTSPNHDLWRTDEDLVPTTIAFHSHHCDLRLEGVTGSFFNVMWEDGPGCHRFYGYTFESKIRGRSGRFRALGPTVYHDRSIYRIRYERGGGWSVNMQAQDIHSVLVPKGETSAWLVTESTEDVNYNPVAWSLQDLTMFTPTGMYAPMANAEASRLIEIVTS
jgi:hypothetical protein